MAALENKPEPDDKSPQLLKKKEGGDSGKNGKEIKISARLEISEIIWYPNEDEFDLTGKEIYMFNVWGGE